MVFKEKTSLFDKKKTGCRQQTVKTYEHYIFFIKVVISVGGWIFSKLACFIFIYFVAITVLRWVFYTDHCDITVVFNNLVTNISLTKTRAWKIMFKLNRKRTSS